MHYIFLCPSLFPPTFEFSRGGRAAASYRQADELFFKSQNIAIFFIVLKLFYSDDPEGMSRMGCPDCPPPPLREPVTTQQSGEESLSRRMTINVNHTG